jgi:hypothetical protein
MIFQLKMRLFMREIPLKIAMVYWTSKKWDGKDAVLIVAHPDSSNVMPGASSDGACWSWWEDATNRKRMEHLLVIFVRLTTFDEIPASLVHAAFLRIPEYREIFANGP